MDANIIKCTVGLLFVKARNVAADKLYEGDLTDESIRGVIVREIYQVKEKLDALSRKDLLSSVSFLKEGLSRLSMALKKKSIYSDALSASQNIPAIPSPLEGLAAVDGASTSQQHCNDAFTASNTVERQFEVGFPERLQKAKESFEESRKEATGAFSNETLSIDDRIIATKLRIVSRIFESFLDDRDASSKDCLLYLEELFSLPTVREMFSVYYGEGFKSYFKSLFNQEERGEKIEIIDSINYELLDFIAGFTTKAFCNGVKWPTIQLRNEEEHTFLSKHDVAERRAELDEYRRMKVRWPQFSIDNRLGRRAWHWTHYGPNTKTLYVDRPGLYSLTDGVTRDLTESGYTDPFDEYGKMIPMAMTSEVQNALCIATSESLWFYVLTYVCKSPNSALVFFIRPFSSDGKSFDYIRTDLDCGSNSSDIGLFAMYAFKNGIAVLREQLDCRRVNFINCVSEQTYHTTFLPRQLRDNDSPSKPLLCILNESDIMVTSRSNEKAVYIYTNEGELKQRIPLPLEEKLCVWNVGFNAVSKDILVLTSVSQDGSPEEQLLECRLLVYSTTGTLQDSYGLSKRLFGDETFFVNYSEGVALIDHCFQIRL